MTDNTPAIISDDSNRGPEEPSFFSGMAAFEDGQRIAQLLSASTIVPREFQKSVPNTMIAIEMAVRMKASPIAVMQSLYVVYGKPSWSGQFIIATVNSSGRFSSNLMFEMSGDGDSRKCVAWAMSPGGERVEGVAVSMAMAKAEGWYGKDGSKWKTIPELMLRYRAATFFGRLHIPDLLMGMQTDDEIHDTAIVKHNGGNLRLIDVPTPDLNKLIEDGATVVDENQQDDTAQDGAVEVVVIKGEIDKIKTSVDIDRWRMDNLRRIEKLSQEWQHNVYAYTDDAHEALKQSEAE